MCLNLHTKRSPSKKKKLDKTSLVNLIARALLANWQSSTQPSFSIIRSTLDSFESTMSKDGNFAPPRLTHPSPLRPAQGWGKILAPHRGAGRGWV